MRSGQATPSDGEPAREVGQFGAAHRRASSEARSGHRHHPRQVNSPLADGPGAARGLGRTEESGSPDLAGARRKKGVVSSWLGPRSRERPSGIAHFAAHLGIYVLKWRRRDSNPWPPACKARSRQAPTWNAPVASRASEPLIVTVIDRPAPVTADQLGTYVARRARRRATARTDALLWKTISPDDPDGLMPSPKTWWRSRWSARDRLTRRSLRGSGERDRGRTTLTGAGSGGSWSSAGSSGIIVA
jgi:hypothetical protein